MNRRPCVISPYHYRMDWLLWFAAFQVRRLCARVHTCVHVREHVLVHEAPQRQPWWSVRCRRAQSYQQQPWLLHLSDKLLRGDDTAFPFFTHNPFPDPSHPPKRESSAGATPRQRLTPDFVCVVFPDPSGAH